MTSPSYAFRYVRAVLTGAASLAAFGLSAQQPPAVNGEPGSVPSILPPAPETVGSIPMITPSIEEAVKAQMAEGKIGAPEGFDMNIYATPPVVYSSVALAAAPDGTTYVGLDGNLSISQFSKLGRIVRLRDLNHDGVADEAKVFAPDVDSIRGMIWDHDRLIVMHTPYISAFYDRDGDGVAEEQKILVRGVGRPVREIRDDHGQNGLDVGIDGWIYLAIGDQGIKEATGVDGRKIQLHGGGVVRFRPDGTGLEIWAIGTRNIYGMAIGPLLDIFARDNTNDGGGWNVRMHHISGLTDHGYPQRFVNFQQEIIQPLAEYPGGSGTGGLWLDEPGYPAEWNNIPITVDWGQGGAYRHVLTPKGATYGISNDMFLRAPYAVDLDVDANGVIYYISTRNGGFRWVNPEQHGLMLRVEPKGHQAAPLPDFNRVSISELVQLHEAPSYRRRLEAQRAILRRRAQADEAIPGLEAIARDATKDLRYRVAALFTLKQLRGSGANPFLGRLLPDATIAAYALRALGDDPAQGGGVPLELVVGSLGSADPRVRKEALITLARLNATQHAGRMAPLLADSDPIVAHTAMQALRQLRATDTAIAVLDSTDVSPAMRDGALAIVSSFHQQDTVEAILTRIEREKDPKRRAELVGLAARLSVREQDWDGEWWGTRPDTGGPYFKGQPWAETDRISKVLKAVLDQADGQETALLGVQFQRMGFDVGAAVAKFIAYADREPALVPQIVNYFATSSDPVPASAIPVMARAAREQTTPAALRTNAVLALVRTSDAEAWNASLDALSRMQAAGAPPPPGTPTGPGGGGNVANFLRTTARTAADQMRTRMLESSGIDTLYPLFVEAAAKMDGERALAAEGVLLGLANRRIGDPAPAEAAKSVVDAGWSNRERRLQIIRTIAQVRDTSRALAVADLMKDSDADVAKAATTAIQQLGVKPDELRAQAALPRLVTMETPQILAGVAELKGDVTKGRQIAQNLGCAACHTFTASEPPKGPYLGAVAGIMRRADIAEAILDPNKTISQGFATNRIALKNGEEYVAFVTRESGDSLTFRDVTAKEHRVALTDIASREHLDISLMPPGLANDLTLPEFASLLDYLVSLAAAH